MIVDDRAVNTAPFEGDDRAVGAPQGPAAAVDVRQATKVFGTGAGAVAALDGVDLECRSGRVRVRRRSLRLR